jgi:hypothetical protein
MNTEKLDSILEIAPEATKPAVAEKTAIEMAAEIISADVIDTTLLIPAGPKASNTMVISTPPAEIAVTPDPHNADLKTDVDFAREQMKDLIEQGRLGVQGAMELAEAGDSPRAYEVVATMITAVIQANKELVHLHKTKLDATRESPATSGRSPDGNIINIDKAVFIGKTDQLLREIKAARKAAAEVANAEQCSSDAQPQALETTNGVEKS